MPTDLTTDRIIVLIPALKAWRHERGISQETLAGRVGVSSAMIALIETGKRQPGAELLDRIAAELNVAPGALALLPTEAAS